MSNDNGFADQHNVEVAKKALKFLAGFEPYADKNPSVHIDRVNRAFTAGEIARLVENGGLSPIPERMGQVHSRNFHVETLEGLAGKTLEEARAEVKQQKRS